MVTSHAYFLVFGYFLSEIRYKPRVCISYDVFQNTTLTIVGNFTSVYCSEMAWKWVYTEPVDLSALASNEEAKKSKEKRTCGVSLSGSWKSKS